MRITPIIPSQPIGDPPPRSRAFMIIHRDKHTVVDTITNERFELNPGEAWRMHEKLNLIV